MIETMTKTDGIIFYCKDCEKIIFAKQVGRSHVYRCPHCHTKNVAFGTEKSIKNYYHIEEKEETPIPTTNEPALPSAPPPSGATKVEEASS